MITDIENLKHSNTHKDIVFNDKEFKRIVLGDWYNSSFILKYKKNKILIDKTSFI